MHIPSYACPSDAGSYEMRDPGGGKVRLAPTSYGFNMGTWFVFDPVTKRGGDGVFYPNSHLPLSFITDGLTNTILAAEVKAWTPYRRNGGPPTTTRPDTPAAAPIVASAPDYKDTGHTEWPDGRVHHTGFTATFPPNTFVPLSVGANIVDGDYNSWQEGRNGASGRATYAIITSRSFHFNAVQAIMLDGSVQSFSSSIDINTWRALATRSGGEMARPK